MSYIVVKGDYDLNNPQDMTVFASYSLELGEKQALRYAKDALRWHKKGAILLRNGDQYTVVQDNSK